MQKAALDPFASTHGAMAAMVGAINWRNWLLTIAPALGMDGPPALRRQIIQRLLAPGRGLAAVLADDDLLEQTVRKHTIGGWHASGTCRMGAASDRLAVVDPRANTNLPTIMLAEKMADVILRRAL